MERLTDENHSKRKVLDHETTQTLTAQIELDKTAEDFRTAHQERQEIIQQWENTLEQMQRRDKEMDLLAAVNISLDNLVMISSYIFPSQDNGYNRLKNYYHLYLILTRIFFIV